MRPNPVAGWELRLGDYRILYDVDEDQRFVTVQVIGEKKAIVYWSRDRSLPLMKVINLEEAKAHLEQYAAECQSSPVVVTVDGKPTFEMIPIRTDDPNFIDRLLEQDQAFQELLEKRHKESTSGRVSSLQAVRERWQNGSP